jgi:hypothetical protein
LALRRGYVFCLLLILSAACAAAPESAGERAAIASAEGGPLACGPAREEALADGVVRIRPGQALCVKLEVSGSTVTPVAVVSGDPADNLFLNCWQDSSGVVLNVQNPLTATLKYRAGMRLPGETGYRRTSSCSVPSDRSVMEHWPHDIDELALTDFRVLPDSDESMVCD